MVHTCMSEEFFAVLRADAKELLSSSLVTPLVCDERPGPFTIYTKKPVGMDENFRGVMEQFLA